MFLRSRARAWALGMVVAGCLAGCGRESLLLETGDGGGGQSSTAPGGSGGGTTGCEPVSEICNNGLDEDCDGEVDEGCACGNGQLQACYSGPAETANVGHCAPGGQLCENGQWGPCTGELLPSPESCDAIDNDCNGLVDDGNPGGGDACNVGLPGLCGQGEKKCQNGQFVCAQVTFASPEICDGLDNDCDGTVDDGNPAGGDPCTTGMPGPCGPGTVTCAGGAPQCLSNTPAGPEACDGIDNDCDGMVDDSVPGSGASCSTGKLGACSAGVTTCTAGAVLCADLNAPSMEICDGIDNDCDGMVDNGVGATVFFSETFADNGAGWTLDDEWQIGPATMSSGQSFGNGDPALDHTASADNGVAGVVIGGNAAQNMLHPFRWLTSPTITVDPAAPEIYLQYWRWLNSDFTPWMANRVEVFNAASNAWIQVWQSGASPGVQDGAWTKQSFPIKAFAQGGSIKLRFGFNIGQNGAFVVSQWNVDDVVVTTKVCD